jgi:hypothetical protein
VTQRIIIDGIRVEGDEAKRIVDEAVHRTDRKGRRRLRLPLGMLTGCALFPGIAAGLLGWGLEHLVGGVPRVWLVLACMIVAVGVSLAWIQIHWRMHRRRLREAMRAHGFELCLECGYWLKGLGSESAHCPECGAERYTPGEAASCSSSSSTEPSPPASGPSASP